MRHSLLHRLFSRSTGLFFSIRHTIKGRMLHFKQTLLIPQLCYFGNFSGTDGSAPRDGELWLMGSTIPERLSW